MHDVTAPADREHFEVIVIGAGQAGLSAAYHLAKRGLRFVILDGSPRLGDSWRNRWGSLKLFTPARIDGLPGMQFPGPPGEYPTKEAMAGYIEAYVERFKLPVRSGVVVDRLQYVNDRFSMTAGGRTIEADQVVVATGANQKPRIPSFAADLDPGIVQLNAKTYRGPAQLVEGGVLVVGAGNSGAEIALEAAKGHRTWLSGRSTGRVSPNIWSPVGWWIARNVITNNTPIGRRFAAMGRTSGAPWLRVTPELIAAAEIERVGRTTGVVGGKPKLADGSVPDVTNVVWCTGFSHDFGWIQLPVFDESGNPRHEKGVVASQRGLYFVGLPFLTGATSALVGGVGRDAERIVNRVVAEARSPSS